MTQSTEPAGRAVVPADVAESPAASESDPEPGAGLRELPEEAEARVGLVPPEVAAEVDRNWAAALASLWRRSEGGQSIG
jgi:hypothetical protein